MKGLIRLVIVALIGYGLYTYFVQNELDHPDEATGDFDSPARCLDRLDDAIDALGLAVREFGVPPIDVAAWDDTYDNLRQRRELAEAACQCQGDTCRKGREASGSFGELISDINDGIQDGGGPPSNAAARLDRILRLYEDGKALL